MSYLNFRGMMSFTHYIDLQIEKDPWSVFLQDRSMKLMQWRQKSYNLSMAWQETQMQ